MSNTTCDMSVTNATPTAFDAFDYMYDSNRYDLILTLAKNKIKVCVILSGLPGSGKSTLANRLVQDLGSDVDAKIFNTDMYFMKNGEYKFNRYALGRNHTKCQEAFRESKAQVKIVDNTNISKSERKPYMEHARITGYVNILVNMLVRPSTQMATDNIHGVPKDAIERMLTRWKPEFNAKFVGIFFPEHPFVEAGLTTNTLLYSFICNVQDKSDATYCNHNYLKIDEKVGRLFKMEFDKISENKAGTALITTSGKSHVVIRVNEGFTPRDFADYITKPNVRAVGSMVRPLKNKLSVIGVMSIAW